MKLILIGLMILLSAGIVPLFSGRRGGFASLCAIAGTFSCLLLSLPACILCIIHGGSFHYSRPMSLPFANFALGLDPLSAIFLIPLLSLSVLCAVFGAGYMSGHGKSSSPGWFFFCLMVLGMSLVVLARNAMLFLIAWEIMTLASFFLVTYENEKKEARTAGWIYLAASHVGAAFIFAVFAILGRHGGNLDFESFELLRQGSLASVSVFIFAVIGFGSKAGFVPLHIWLPEAHPAAPSHVSALMSGIMIKLGIYGILRTLMFLGEPRLWWGVVFIAVGVSSATTGIVFAVASRDIKRLLAYSSIENIGIISLGLGLGMAGMACGQIGRASCRERV